ncbi:sensor histidine kinase [Psychroserpens ponticola]|uniref:Sensor histidine kinase n=1 Tax=Psychroserpens ponticola TaxID=2932268 RepID=A0ABY7S1K1_9FLAO|nr:sensor histidine kinase [Psychroserpens ponticola]WCO02796.1 sensor histidine kinase [Psychroserpens ponticola]
MRHKTLIYSMHFCFWIGYLAIQTWVFSYFLDFATSLLRGCINGIPLMLLAYTNIWAVNTFFEKKKYVLYTIAVVFIMTLISLIRLYVNVVFSSFNTDFGFLEQEESLLIGIILSNILFLMFSAFYQILVNRFVKTRLQANELQAHQEAQLQYLRSQMNPHFLFNTLNNIYALATIKSEKTAPMVLKLSHLLRYMVYQEDQTLVLLNNELTLIQDYIDLYKLKSEGNLNVSLYIQGNIDHQMIEPMILIPIIENSFKHSDLETNANAFIKIDIKVEDTSFIFKVANTKNDTLKQKDDIGGVGLSNIKKRLNILNPEHSFILNDTEKMFVVNLKLKLTQQ